MLGVVVPAAPVLFDIKYSVMPLLVSCKKLDQDALLLDFNHTKSGLNPAVFTIFLLDAPLPVHKVASMYRLPCLIVATGKLAVHSALKPDGGV